MKKYTSFVLLLLGMLFGSVDSFAKTPEAELKALEVRFERLESTMLPDFAPQSFRSVRLKLRELRAIYEKEGRVPPKLMAETQQELEKFQLVADRTRKIMNKTYSWRNAAVQYNFVRSFDPAALYRAEQTYNEALKLASEQKFEEARRLASMAKRQFKTLIRDAHSHAKKTMGGALKTYKKGSSRISARLKRHPAASQACNAQTASSTAFAHSIDLQPDSTALSLLTFRQPRRPTALSRRSLFG